MTVGRVCADIGTDHALLPCSLIINGVMDYAYACDIAEGPLERAKENIDKYLLSDKIETVLANGIRQDVADKSSDIIIAGMGGEMIADIISNVSLGNVNLIMQPMTHPEILRGKLYELGFVIDREETVFDNGKVYSVIKAVRGSEKPYSAGESEAGRQILLRMNDTDKLYVKNRLNLLYNRHKGDNSDYIKNAIKELEEVL